MLFCLSMLLPVERRENFHSTAIHLLAVVQLRRVDASLAILARLNSRIRGRKGGSVAAPVTYVRHRQPGLFPALSARPLPNRHHATQAVAPLLMMSVS